ncbi:hypothetical protein INT45_013553 [Circinella minor]|uniref:Uncharacterized protein n=1 Tax=Circinella minor TaxID=1195481 RepID=A0A8H7VL50_9FUNG|nr:hypothetical protein INT45_013553 [Circinella minor]
MSHHLTVVNNDKNNITTTTDGTLNKDIKLLIENDDNDGGNDEEHNDFNLAPSFLSTHESSHKQHSRNKKKYIHAFEKKFMMITDGYMTEDNTRERQQQQQKRVKRHQQENRTMPLNIPISPASLSPSSAFDDHVTHLQKTKNPVLSVTCPVNNNNTKDILSSIQHCSGGFTVGSMPEQESPIPWPSQIINNHIRTPDSVTEQQYHSDYILSPVPVMMDDSPLLFDMDQ